MTVQYDSLLGGGTLNFTGSDINLAGQQFMQQDFIEADCASLINFINTQVNTAGAGNNELAVKAPDLDSCSPNMSIISLKNIGGPSVLKLTEITVEGKAELATVGPNNLMQAPNVRSTAPPMGAQNVCFVANTQVEDQFIFLINGTTGSLSNIQTSDDGCFNGTPGSNCPLVSFSCPTNNVDCTNPPTSDPCCNVAGNPYNISVTNTNIGWLRAVIKAPVNASTGSKTVAQANLKNPAGRQAHEFETAGDCCDTYDNSFTGTRLLNGPAVSGVVKACQETWQAGQCRASTDHVLTANLIGPNNVQAFSFVPTSEMKGANNVYMTAHDLQSKKGGLTTPCQTMTSDCITVTDSGSKVGEVNSDGQSMFKLQGDNVLGNHPLMMAAPFTASHLAQIIADKAAFSTDAVGIFAARADTNACFPTPNPQIVIQNCTAGLPVTCLGNPGNLCATQAYAARGKITFGTSTGDTSCGRPNNIVYNLVNAQTRTNPICDPDPFNPGQFLGTVCAVCTDADNAGGRNWCPGLVGRLVNVCPAPAQNAWTTVCQ